MFGAGQVKGPEEPAPSARLPGGRSVAVAYRIERWRPWNRPELYQSNQIKGLEITLARRAPYTHQWVTRSPYTHFDRDRHRISGLPLVVRKFPAPTGEILLPGSGRQKNIVPARGREKSNSTVIERSRPAHC